MSDEVAKYGIAIDSSAAEQGRDKTVRAFKDIVSAAGQAGEAERRRQAIFAQDQSVQYVRGLAQASTEAGRRMALMEMEALKIDAAMRASAASTEAATVATATHGLQLGRLRMELGTLAGRLTGTNTAMDRMGGAIGAMAIGDPMVIGVLAGIAALGFAYEQFAGDAHKAAVEQEKAVKALEDWHAEQQRGAAGKFGMQVEGGEKQLQDDIKEMLRLKAVLDHPTNAGIVRGREGSAGQQYFAAQALKDTKEQYDKVARAVADGEQHVADLHREAAVKSLSERLAFNQRDATARTEALALLKRDQEEYAKWLAMPYSEKNSGEVAKYAEEIKRIQESLKPKDKASADGRKYDTEQRALTQLAALDAHRLEAARALDEAASHGRAEYEKTLHTQEIEKQILDEQYTILRDHLDTNGKIRKGEEGAVAAEQQAAADRLREIDSLNQSAKAKLDFDEKAHVSRTAWAHEEAQAAKAFADEQLRVAKALESDLLRAVASFTTNGLNDFRSFFAEVERAALTMTGHLDDALQKDAAMFADAMERNDMESAKTISDQMHQLEQLRRFTAPIAAGIAAATTGYQIGRSTGSTTMGAVGGAASGAMAGAAFGPWGAAAGALVGLTAGIIGAGHAAAEAAKQMHELQTALALNMAALRADVNHDTLAQSIASVNANREQLRKQIEDAYSGGGATSQQVATRMANLTEMNRLEDARIQQLKEEAALALKQANEDVQIAILRNNGQTAQADALAVQVDQERRFAALRKQGIDDATIAALALSEAAKKSADAAIAARQANRDLEDLSVRMLAAQGYTQASDDAAFRNQQQRAYQDAVDAKKSPEYLALLTAVQVQEAIQRATQLEVDRQTTIIQDANKAQQAAFDAQLKTANDTLKVNQDALRTAEQSAQALQQVVDNLKNFSDSLKLSDLSPLSPIDQLAEAKRQLDADYAKAQGGDLQAGGDFANIAKAFLTASRDVNASGTAYASDFATVQQMTDALQGKFGPQLSEQQQIVAQLTSANAALQAQIVATQAAKDAAQASADAAIAAQQALLTVNAKSTADIVSALERNRNTVTQPADVLLASLEAVRASVTGAALATITSEQAALLESRNAAAAAANAQIAAIQEGRDAATIQQLALINELQATRLASNTQAIAVEAELIKNGVLGQSAVDTLVANRQAADAAAIASIAAIQNGSDAATRDNLQQIATLEQSRLAANSAAYNQELALAAQRAVLERQIAERQAAETYQQQQDDVQLQTMLAQKAALDQQTAAVESVRSAADRQALDQIAVLVAIRDKNWTPTIVFTPPATTTNAGYPTGGGSGGSPLDANGNPIRMFAGGGTFGGGMRLVGERGPELEFTGPSRIVSASQTSAMLADALGQSAEMAAELRDLNDSSAATVAVLQAGLSALVARVEALAARVEENTKVTKRGFEGMS